MPNIKQIVSSLLAPVNKVVEGAEDDTKEGVLGSLLPELKLSMKDDALLALTSRWKEDWVSSDVSRKWLKDCKEIEDYWLGKQYDDTGEDHPLQDNILFESLETFLAIVTRKNPEPTVIDPLNTTDGKTLSQKVARGLSYLADFRTLKLKLKKVTRYWSLYRLGVIKIVWDLKENEIDFRVLRPQKLILDPDATVNEGVYTGEYIGEYRKASAKTLIQQFPSQTEYITGLAKKKLNTQLQYIEWWTNEYVCWELSGTILDKSRNPHYNYPETQTTTDEYGMQVDNTVAGTNHFLLPRMPYMFLSVFNLGQHPVDDTSLMKQNLASQDLVNKRLKQIDRNADNLNGGWAFSGELSGLTKAQTSEAVEAIRDGGAVYVPKGDVNRAVAKMVGTPLPTEVYNQLVDVRTEIRNNMGVRGSTPQGISSEKTVRGKIITAGQDADRLSLIAEYLEQVADQAYNWCVQMMTVYYDQPHQAPANGDVQQGNSNALSKEDFTHRLLVSVKEGSLIPKDPLTVRNEAIDLWSAKALDPISLYKALDFPNPEEMALKLFMWMTNPQALFMGQPGMQPQIDPTTGQPMAPAGQPGMPPTGVPAGPNTLNNQNLQQGQTPDVLSKVPIQPLNR